ncbi:MAG TPA: cupin [Clostridiales bacterium]|nr:cupin [Clostridiales bacterium]
MIKRAESMIGEIRERMRGGTGQVTVTPVFLPGEYRGKARLIARITLNPGCSIGYHQHLNEEEIFYILKGEAVLADGQENSEQVLRPGDASITLDGQSHSIRNPGGEPLELLALILLDA